MEYSKELQAMLNDFVISELGKNAMYGVTYALVLKDDNIDMDKYNKYMQIKRESVHLGFADNQVFRIYEVNNGYILDMDLSTCKTIVYKLGELTAKKYNENFDYRNIIGDNPEQRRKRDLVKLSRKLKAEFDKGNRLVEVALFSRNVTSKIVINARDKNGARYVIPFDAYVLRHWDLEILNEQHLIPAGFRVSRVRPCEILPSKTGVRFQLTLEEV